MCLYPKLIKNRKYTATKKNKGIIPELKDKRAEYVPVGCGKCIECMKQKARSWYIRLQEEIKVNKTGKFVTLTFSNEYIYKLSENLKSEGYNLDNDICKIAVRRFLERWRKKHKKSVKHWLVSEIGGHGSENIHLHGIIFTDNVKDIKEIWKYGYVFIGDYVNCKTISYITKYITKTDVKHKYYTQIVLCSPGIGSNYINSHNAKNNIYKGKDTNEFYKNQQGYKMNLPIYYRNNIYNDNEKENLWLMKLDKNIRYVCGEKIDVSITDDNYYNVLNFHQKRNKILGYGDDKKDWNQKLYENQKRNLKIKERIKKR